MQKSDSLRKPYFKMNSLSEFIDIVLSNESIIYANESMIGHIIEIEHEKYFNLDKYSGRLHDIGFKLKLSTIQTKHRTTLEVDLLELSNNQPLSNDLYQHLKGIVPYETLCDHLTIQIYANLTQRCDPQSDWDESSEEVEKVILAFIDSLFNDKVLSEDYCEMLKLKHIL